MEKIDLGEVKESKRIKNGVEQKIRLFTKKQRQIIKDAVENRPDGMIIEDVLNIYEVSPAVYYTWIRNDKEAIKDVGDQLPNPLSETFDGSNVFSSSEDLKKFYEDKSPELKEFIKMKFQEWLEKGLIDKMSAKINAGNIIEVAKAGNITTEELNDYLKGNKDLNYFSIEGIRRYLQI